MRTGGPAYRAGLCFSDASPRRRRHRGLFRRGRHHRSRAGRSAARRVRLFPGPSGPALVGADALRRRDRDVRTHRDLDPRHRRPRQPRVAADHVRLSAGPHRRRLPAPAGLFRRLAGHGIPAARTPLRHRGPSHRVRRVLVHALFGRRRAHVRDGDHARGHHALESARGHPGDRCRVVAVHLGRRLARGRLDRRDSARRLPRGRRRHDHRGAAHGRRRERVRACLGRRQAPRVRLSAVVHRALYVLGRVDRRRAALGGDARPRASVRAATPRRARAERCATRAHRLGRVHHSADRAVPVGRYDVVAPPGPAAPRRRGDALSPPCVIPRPPPGLAGLVVAGILAAAMSSHASAVNSLASAATHDFYAPITGKRDPQQLLRVGRWLTLIWTAVLVGGALAFKNQNTPVVQLALSIASLTYGALLGTYILGGFWARARQIDVIIALVTSIILMSPVVLGAVFPHFPIHWLPGLAWPWYVPLGTIITVLVGMISSLFGQRVAE